MANLLTSLLGANNRSPERATVATDHVRVPPEDPGLAVEVLGVSKAYDDFWALREISFEVRKGECVGIVGYNGAGKSTLLQIIAGTLQPSAGRVRSRGRTVALLELGAGYNDDFTGLENMYLSAAILGVPREVIDARLPEIEAFAEIGDFLRKPVKTYSSGMRVRLAFSMLTQVDPEIMIIDEALAVGDAYFTHKCTRVIRRFREQGRTLLFVSHDAGAVKTLCDRAILLDRGAVVRNGTPIDVLDYYNAMIAARERDLEIRQQELLGGRRIMRSGNRKAVIDRFDLLDEYDRPVRAVLAGSRVRICCVIEFREPLTNPTVGFLIRDRLGNDVFGTNTSYLNPVTGSFGPGDRAEVSFTTTLNLGAGNYSLTLATHQGASHIEENYDWCDQLLAFMVVPNWPFRFIGVAALPAEVEIAREVQRLRRRCVWGQKIDFSVQGNAHLYQLEGWSIPEASFSWTNGPRADLAFELPSFETDAQLTVDAVPYLAPGMKVQEIEVQIGDERVARWQVATAGEYSCIVPARLLRPEIKVSLISTRPISPASLGLSSDARQLALAVRHLKWEQSAR